MAVSWKDNVLRVTSANDGVDSAFKAFSISVRASADAWAIILKDKDGQMTKFEMGSSVVNDRGGHYAFPEGINFNGLTVNTATNITCVILTTKAIQIIQS